jgi:hypothetical protein
VFSVGLRDELKLGQANLWPLLLVLPAWFIARRGSDERGVDWTGLAIGALWALAVQWKLYALALAPLWLLRRRISVWLGAVLFTGLSLFGILALAHGPAFAVAENLRWLQSLTTSSEELLISEYNVSALGVFGKWGQYFGVTLGPSAYVAWAGLAAAWGITLWWAERVSLASDAPFLRLWSTSWAWAGIVVLNPLVWPYWLVFCVPLFAGYVTDALRQARGRPDGGFLLVCTLFAAANWLQNTGLVHRGASFVAVLVLLYDAQRRARRRDLTKLPSARELPGALQLTERSS